MNENKEIKVLDHGYVSLVETWGSEERIIEAARMSTSKGFLGWEDGEGKVGDEKLLSYLYNNKHFTPFEMAGMIIEVKAPIFIFREWHRHRTQSYNEMSARYISLPDENYIPSVERLMMQGNSNKQASGSKEVTIKEACEYSNALKQAYYQSQKHYENTLAHGIPKELARLILPVGRYSKMRASANLRNWLAFLTLRDDTHAQWEIQQYAKAVAVLLEEKFPRTYALYLGEKEKK